MTLRRRISVLACVVSVSVQFRSKERGTTVKDRVKKGGSRSILRAAKTENPVPRRSLVFLCSQTTRKRLLRRLRIYKIFDRKKESAQNFHSISSRTTMNCNLKLEEKLNYNEQVV